MEVSLNWLIIIAMTLASFAIGGIWQGVIWGKLYGKIHHGEKGLSAAEMKKAGEGMWKFMLLEILAIFIMVMTLDFLIKMLPTMSGMHVGFMVWLGYVLPTLTSTIIWGGDKKMYMAQKIAILASNRLIGLLVSGWVLGMMI